MRWTSSLLLLPLVACASVAPRPPRAVMPVAPVTHAAPSNEPVAPEPRGGSRFGYAESPLTALADDMTGLAFAVVRGEPTPPTMLPITGIDPDEPQQKDGGNGIPDLDRMALVGFALELDISVGQASASGAERAGRLRTVVWLGSTGVRVARLRVADHRAGRPLPAPMNGLEAVAASLHRALVAGDIRSMFLGDAERPDFQNEEMFREAIDELPDDDTLAEAHALADAASISGYAVDDVVVLLRAPDDGFWGLRMDFEEDSSGALVIEANPIVTVRRVRDL
jgi:hypothetical protein